MTKAGALDVAQSSEPEALVKAVRGLKSQTPQGPVLVDPENNHSFGTPRIGLSREDGRFDVIWEGAWTKPDPYMISYDRRIGRLRDA